jgi:hypothetical protein
MNLTVLGAFRGIGVAALQRCNVILTCINGNTPCTMKCIYDLPSYAEGWLHSEYTSGVSPFLTVCRDGQPSQSRFKPRGWLCVEFCYSFPAPGTLNDPALLTVALVSFWHVMAGIYL